MEGQRDNNKNGLAAGWILVTGLFLLCLTGTGLTWWNYTRHVFSSAHGIVQHDANSTLIVVNDFPPFAAEVIRPGHQARVSTGSDASVKVMKGVVISVTPETLIVMIRLLDEKLPPLANGSSCSVTVDTTVPPTQEMPTP